MKKKIILFLSVLLTAGHLHAFTPSIMVAVKDGTLQAGTTTGFYVSRGKATEFESSVATATSKFQSFNTNIMGTGIITGSTCAASTAVGGGLTIGHLYYWKVYAIPATGNGSVGSQSGLTSMTMTANVSQRAARLSWDPVTGADHYAITRHSGLTGPDGLVISTITNTVFLDTGVALSAANPWPSTPYGSTCAYFSSGILMNANMPIVWNDYMSGSPLAYIGPTSAGEWGIKSGLGVNKNNVYLLNTLDVAYWRFLEDPNDTTSVMNAMKPSGADGAMKFIAGSSASFTVDNVSVLDISASGLNIHPTSNGNGVVLFNSASNQSSVIRNNGGSTVANVDLVHGGSPSAVTVRTSATGNVEFSVTDSSITEALPAFFSSSATVSSTMTCSNNLLLTGEFRPGLTSGTTGQILVAQAAGFAPKFQWAGEIIQIATQTVLTSSATTSSTVGNTHLSCTITPKSISSKIKITVNGLADVDITNKSGLFTISRGNTNIASGGGTNNLAQIFTSAGGELAIPLNIVTTDTPQTTSAITYTLQFKVTAGATLSFGSTQVQSIMILEEIGQN